MAAHINERPHELKDDTLIGAVVDALYREQTMANVTPAPNIDSDWLLCSTISLTGDSES
jgi:hypothetical protein